MKHGRVIFNRAHLPRTHYPSVSASSSKKADKLFTTTCGNGMLARTSKCESFVTIHSARKDFFVLLQNLRSYAQIIAPENEILPYPIVSTPA